MSSFPCSPRDPSLSQLPAFPYPSVSPTPSHALQNSGINRQRSRRRSSQPTVWDTSPPDLRQPRRIFAPAKHHWSSHALSTAGDGVRSTSDSPPPSSGLLCRCAFQGRPPRLAVTTASAFLPTLRRHNRRRVPATQLPRQLSSSPDGCVAKKREHYHWIDGQCTPL